MKDKKKKKSSSVASANVPLSDSTKKIFLVLTISLPFILFFLVEISLRIFNYGGNLDVFIAGPEGYERYLRCNPNVARRYFSVQSIVPTPPKQLFLKQKPVNGYRIFVMGESSTAGFPYGNNVSFPNILERGLANTFPEKNIEVINVALSAINSYALLDLADEILEQSPDALLIYTGHNEYYGALGVGSSQSLGNSRWLIRTYLNLQSWRSFIAFRDALGWITVQINRMLYKGSEVDPSATLMEKIVGEQTIPYGSTLYEAGKEQFRENIEAILQRASSRGVRVVLSELVSNLRDQEPFISLDDDTNQSAKKHFASARRLETTGEYEKAKEEYVKAKDLDALRFRAPDEFNTLLHTLAKQYSSPIVPAVSYFEKESPYGLIGNNLMLEHLHPNKEGYFLLAKAFYETMRTDRMIDTVWRLDGITAELNRGITGLDSVYAALVVQHLKEGWPFQPRSLPNRFVQNFKPADHLEEVAFRILPSEHFSLESGHMELGGYYEKRNELDKAFEEYNALITSIPQEIEFYKKAVTVLLAKKEYANADRMLRKSLKFKESDFANKWIGQIAFLNEQYKEAIQFLTKGDARDTQVLFNLSRSYFFDNQLEKGEEYFQRLQKLAPGSQYAVYLAKLRVVTQMKRNTTK